MTELLEQAIKHLRSLDADRQDAIRAARTGYATATLIMEELEDEAKWDAAFAKSQHLLADLGESPLVISRCLLNGAEASKLK